VTAWWIAWAGGIVLLVLGELAVTHAHGEQRVPRFGFFAPRPPQRLPWWSWVVFLAGPFLVVVASGRLTTTSGGMFAVGFLGIALALIGQQVVIWWHNRRVSSTAGR
jgi:hypothetical protein